MDNNSGLPWLVQKPQPTRSRDSGTASLRRSLQSRLSDLEGDVSALPAVQYRAAKLDRAVDAGTTVASFFSKTFGLVSLVPSLFSGGGMSTPDYYARYNTSPRTQQLIDKGFRLLFTPEVIRDLNAYMSKRTLTMSGRGILLMAQRFDDGFSPRGSLAHWMAYLIRQEWVDDTALDRRFSATSSSYWKSGGMRGGYNGAYWGISQFSASTYSWVLSFAKANGLNLPSNREATSFEEQIVAAYVLGVLNQSIIRPFVSGELTERQLYIAHNQGAGVFKDKRISSKRFNAQSVKVQRLLKAERFVIV